MLKWHAPWHLSQPRGTAKSLQSCPTLCDPIDSSPPGSPVPGILQARTLEWVAISFSNAWKWKVKGKSISHVQLIATPRTVEYQAPPSMGFSRQEYWSGMPLPSPRGTAVLPNHRTGSWMRDQARWASSVEKPWEVLWRRRSGIQSTSWIFSIIAKEIPKPKVRQWLWSPYWLGSSDVRHDPSCQYNENKRSLEYNLTG